VAEQDNTGSMEITPHFAVMLFGDVSFPDCLWKLFAADTNIVT
jgi:hypothetical protein